jgi:uncharacterized alpha-E superfamily protein
MLSRAADNIYWFGRYMQRAENTARLVNVHAYLSLDLPRRVQFSWNSLIEIIGAQDSFAEHYGEPTEANVARFLLADERYPGSLLNSLQHGREILRASRESMPRETWEKLNDLYMQVLAQADRVGTRRSRQDLLRQIIDGCLMINGMLVSNMSRDVGFQFLRMGMALEQSDMTTRIIDVRSGSLFASRHAEDLRPFQAIQWMSVLKSLTAYQMYRRHVRIRVSGPSVLRFLLQDRFFPRSVLFSLWSIQQTLPRLPNHRSVERALERTTAIVRDADIDGLMDEESDAGIGDLMDEIQISLGELHGAIANAFFRV